MTEAQAALDVRPDETEGSICSEEEASNGVLIFGVRFAFGKVREEVRNGL